MNALKMALTAGLVGVSFEGAACGSTTEGRQSPTLAQMGTPCRTADDCRDSLEAQQVGRCGPELACVSGGCRAECLGSCGGASEAYNPCGELDERGICNQPARPGPNAIDNYICTKRQIHCVTSADCPIYLPGEGQWSCDSEVCVFPGYRAPYD